MYARTIAVRSIFLIWPIWALLALSAHAQPTLTVLTHDSIVAKEGLGPAVQKLFEADCRCRLVLKSAGAAGQIAVRLQLDAERAGRPGSSSADVVWGMDQFQWQRMRQWAEPWGSWKPRGSTRLVNGVWVAEGFLPYDYGVLAFMSDQERLKALTPDAKPPARLDDLLNPRWKRQFLLQDPRASTPGLIFVLWAQALKQEGSGVFWAVLRRQWKALLPGWDEAYGLFLKEEAPLVWSYTSSQAYHAAHGDSQKRYRAVVFEEGHPVQVEGAAIVLGTRVLPLARRFLEFLLTPDVQRLVQERNWMLPVIRDAPIHPAFADLPQPRRLVSLPADRAAIERVLKEWTREVER